MQIFERPDDGKRVFVASVTAIETSIRRWTYRLYRLDLAAILRPAAQQPKI